MKYVLLPLILAASLAACATPGYDYSGRFAPENVAVTDYRNVDVAVFDGPAGRDVERAFERMIASATLDGQPWFNVSYETPNGPEGIYSGEVDVTGYEVEHYHKTVKECVEWDGLFDCEHRADVEKACTRKGVEVAVRARLEDAYNGQLIHQGSHFGDASNELCETIAEFHADGRGNEHSHVGGYGESREYGVELAPYELIREAALEAARAFRTDIAPYNRTVRAKIMTQALDPFLASDPRFADAVQATKDGKQITACSRWQALAADYAKAPAILHNQGACAEANGDAQSAQAYYTQASKLARGLPGLDEDAMDILASSLERISSVRIENTILDEAAGIAAGPLLSEGGA